MAGRRTPLTQGGLRMKMSRKKKIDRFDRKYKDKGGYPKFKEMVTRLETLEAIGQHFGFSRQNAAGVYQSLFGRTYNLVQSKRKATNIEKQQTQASNLDERLRITVEEGRERSYKKIFYTKILKEICEKRNYEVKIHSGRSGVLRTSINGYTVTISGTSTKTIYHIPKKREPSIYYRFAVTTKPCDFCIFVLETIPEKFVFYIIPYREIRDLTLITLKDRTEQTQVGTSSRTGYSKYTEYMEAWDLLSQRIYR